MDVNSKYIRNIIFSFLDEKAKLNLIKYNKYFQKSFSIDIEYYKIISRRYIVKDLNGYAKEYLLNTNELIFEGQYKNNIIEMVKELNIMMVKRYSKDNF